jgi:hypothetical protein
MDGRVTRPAVDLQLAAALSRPVTPAGSRVLPVRGPLGELFAGGAIRRGSTVGIGPAPAGAGRVSLALSLVAAATSDGGWTVAVGLSELGVVAAAELGVDLRRLALVPAPGERWAAVAAAVLDGVDVVLLGLPAGPVRAADARRLVARTREQGTVLVILEPPGPPTRRSWPEGVDVRCSVTTGGWEGLGAGAGYLRRRRLEVVATGRRAAGRERHLVLWLPGTSGPPEAVHESPLREAPGRLPTPAALVG